MNVSGYSAESKSRAGFDSSHYLSRAKIFVFQQKILAYYATHRRDLPWRQTTDRYAILVSEVMLQQTQVDRVIPKYLRWTQVFPDLQTLASASLTRVLTEWSGLGYNNRAKRLWEAAQQLTLLKVFPETPEELQKLPGIGPYTARAILIFADNKDLVTVDTNIRRIFIAEFGLPETISLEQLYVFAEHLLPLGKSRDWHNALMDYGSSILTSKITGIRALTRQGKFEGSNRWYRGKILKALLTAPLKKEKLYGLLDTERSAQDRIDSALWGLINEGLIELYNETVRLKR